MGVQARKQAEAIEIGMRMDRLAQQAGDSMVTTNTLASMDEDDDSALKRLNLILKVPSSLSCSARCLVLQLDSKFSGKRGSSFGACMSCVGFMFDTKGCKMGLSSLLFPTSLSSPRCNP